MFVIVGLIAIIWHSGEEDYTPLDTAGIDHLLDMLGDAPSESSVSSSSAAQSKLGQTGRTPEKTSESGKEADAGSQVSGQKTNLSQSQQESINDAFFNWAVGRVETAKMAVSRNYFDHGAGGYGDWNACTVDGPVLAQDLGKLGSGNHYVSRAIGDSTFYYSKNGVVGDAASDDVSVPSPDAISGVTKPGTEGHRYLLCDNGKVYELIGKVGRSTGYNQASDDGSGLPPVGQEVQDPSGQIFIVSEDTDAQAEFQKLLDQYK